MGIRESHEHLAPVFEMNMILVAEVLDAAYATDNSATVCCLYPQMLGADADGVGSGGHRRLRE